MDSVHEDLTEAVPMNICKQINDKSELIQSSMNEKLEVLSTDVPRQASKAWSIYIALSWRKEVLTMLSPSIQLKSN